MHSARQQPGPLPLFSTAEERSLPQPGPGASRAHSLLCLNPLADIQPCPEHLLCARHLSALEGLPEIEH